MSKFKEIGAKLGDLADSVAGALDNRVDCRVDGRAGLPPVVPAPIHNLHPDTRIIVPDEEGYTFPDPGGSGEMMRIQLGTPRSQRGACRYCGTAHKEQFCPGCGAPRGG